MNTDVLSSGDKPPGSIAMRRFMSICFLAVLGCFWISGDAIAETDLLSLPAHQVSRDSLGASVLFDVANTGKRLVAVGESGRIVYSEDNGATWIQAKVPTSVTLTAVFFPTVEQGWAVGHDGIVLHSADGGKSWVKQIDGNHVNQITLAGVEKIIREKKNQLEKATPEEQENLAVELEDLEFLLKDTKTAIDEGPSRPFMDLWFEDEREGVVVGAFGMILHTLDGGMTWHSMVDRIDNPDGYHYYGITRAGSLFLAGEGGMLFRWDDEKATWTRLELEHDGSFFGIIGSPDGEYVIAFGQGGDAYRSDDQGASWEPVEMPESGSLSGASILSDGSVVMVSTAGALVHSVDRGKRFSLLRHRAEGCVAAAEARPGEVVLAGIAGLDRIVVKDVLVK